MAAPGRAGAPALGGGVRRAARARPGRRDPVQARPHRRAPGGVRAPRPVLRVGAGRLADPPAAGARAADRPPGRRRDGRGGAAGRPRGAGGGPAGRGRPAPGRPVPGGLIRPPGVGARRGRRGRRRVLVRRHGGARAAGFRRGPLLRGVHGRSRVADSGRHDGDRAHPGAARVGAAHAVVAGGGPVAAPAPDAGRARPSGAGLLPAPGRGGGPAARPAHPPGRGAHGARADPRRAARPGLARPDRRGPRGAPGPAGHGGASSWSWGWPPPGRP